MEKVHDLILKNLTIMNYDGQKKNYTDFFIIFTSGIIFQPFLDPMARLMLKATSLRKENLIASNKVNKNKSRVLIL